MGPTVLLLLVVVAVAAHLATPASAAFSEEPPATRCAAAIVSIAPCLAHVALVAPPARPTAAPTDACCAAFLRGVSSGGGGEGCFCHLLRDPLLLGFPVDAARLGALLPTCAASNASADVTVEASTLFTDTCRDLKSLPEMHFRPPNPSPSPTPQISPAAVPAVPGPVPLTPTMQVLSASVPHDRSESEPSSSCHILLVVLALTAAAANLIPLRF